MDWRPGRPSAARGRTPASPATTQATARFPPEHAPASACAALAVAVARADRAHADARWRARRAAEPAPAHRGPASTGGGRGPARGGRDNRCSHRPAAQAPRGEGPGRAGGRNAGGRRLPARAARAVRAGTRRDAARGSSPCTVPPAGAPRVALIFPGSVGIWLPVTPRRTLAAMTLISTPFGFSSTAAEVAAGIDLTGKRAIVTGASSGIGIETARALAGAGAQVTLAVRDTDAGAKTAADIETTTG